ncbi:MAG: hypothetical protein ACREM1_05280 [Longimicrobiales bacterium]
MTRRRRKPSCALLLLLLANCGTPDSNSISDADALTPLRLEEELRIGSVDDPDVGFSRIGDVAVDRDGLVYVAETQDLRIRVYDAEGPRVRTIGRAGQGPGEFGSISGLGLIGDTLWTTDFRLQRVTLMNRLGEVFRTFQIPRLELQPLPGIVMVLGPEKFRPDGSITATVRQMMFASTPPTDSFSVPYVRLDTTGKVLDTLRYDRMAFAQNQNTIEVGSRSISVPEPPPSSRLIVDVGDDRFVVDRPVATAADGARFTVAYVTASGDTTFRREFAYRPRTFDSVVIDSLIQRRTAFLARQTNVDIDAVRAALRQAIQLPAFQSPIAHGLVAEDSVLWLQREDGGAAQRRWLLIAPDGSPRGMLEVPRAAQPRWIRGDIVWASVPDEFDVPWLVRYRLVATEDGAH